MFQTAWLLAILLQLTDATGTTDGTIITTDEQAAEAELRRYASPELIQKLHERRISIPLFLQAFKWAVRGVAAYRHGEYGEALHYLRKAYGAVRSPMPLYWLGRTYEAFGDGANAAVHLERFLRMAETWDLTHIKEKYITDARQRLQALEGKLVKLVLDVTPAGTQLLVNGQLLRDVDDNIVRSPLEHPVWLNPGVNVILLTRKGYLTHRLVITARAGTRVTKSVRLLTPQEYVRQSREYRRMVEQRRRLRARIAAERKRILANARRRRRMFTLAGYGLEAMGALLFATSGVTGWLAYSSKETIESVPDGTKYWHDYADEYDDFHAYRAGSIGTAVAGALAVAAGWYFLRRADGIHPRLPPIPPPLKEKEGEAQVQTDGKDASIAPRR